MRTARRRYRTAARPALPAVAAAVLLAAGCGQRGELYLAQDHDERQPAPSRQTPQDPRQAAPEDEKP